MTIILGKCDKCGKEYKVNYFNNEEYQDCIECKESLCGKILICPNCQMKHQKIISISYDKKQINNF